MRPAFRVPFSVSGPGRGAGSQREQTAPVLCRQQAGGLRWERVKIQKDEDNQQCPHPVRTLWTFWALSCRPRAGGAALLRAGRGLEMAVTTAPGFGRASSLPVPLSLSCQRDGPRLSSGCGDELNPLRSGHLLRRDTRGHQAPHGQSQRVGGTALGPGPCHPGSRDAASCRALWNLGSWGGSVS